MDAPLSGTRFSLAGPGVVGSTLARWLVARGARLAFVGARDPAAATRLATELDAEPTGLDELATDSDDLVLLTVADAALEAVATTLSDRPQAAVALHVAGGHDAGVLSPLRRAGCALGTFHPLRAFPEIGRDPREAEVTCFTLGGDPAALTLGTRLAEALRGRPVRIDGDRRPLYHLAASLAAGGAVTLLAVADELARALDLPRDVTRGYFDLARQALLAARGEDRPAAALTGPVARGDAATVARQLARLQATAPHLVGLFVTLAEETRRQRAAVGPPSPGDDEIGRILAKAKERKHFLDPV
mgnify:CR=1 FL=1